MRVATEQSEDLLDLTCISGEWVTENCEPVKVEFAWERLRPAPAVTVEECICPPAVYGAIEALWNAASQNGRGLAAAAGQSRLDSASIMVNARCRADSPDHFFLLYRPGLAAVASLEAAYEGD